MAGKTAIASQITYTPWGAPASWVAASNATYTRTFDNDGRITSITYGSTTNSYYFDANNRITSITETGLPSKTFSYDALGRIKTYAAGPNSQTYTYDANGNRTALTSGSATISYTIAPSSNQLQGATGTQVATTTFDVAGNTIKDLESAGTFTHIYDAQGHRVVTVEPGNNGTLYLFNGLGERIIRGGYGAIKASAGIFYYDSAHHLIGEYDLAGNPIQETIWLGDLPIATISQGSIYAIYPDHLGAPHSIVNASGQQVWFWDHDPFGNGQPTGTLTYNLRFPGQYYDFETGLFYNMARDYNPATGRYIQSDPIGLKGGLNTYVYVGGNPLNAIDPRGLVEFVSATAPPVPAPAYPPNGQPIPKDALSGPAVFSTENPGDPANPHTYYYNSGTLSPPTPEPLLDRLVDAASRRFTAALLPEPQKENPLLGTPQIVPNIVPPSSGPELELYEGWNLALTNLTGVKTCPLSKSP